MILTELPPLKMSLIPLKLMTSIDADQAAHLLIRSGSMLFTIVTKYWDRQALANNVDPDQMPLEAASDQGLHCLPLQQAVKWTFKF